MRTWILLGTLLAASLAGCLSTDDQGGLTAAERLDFPYYSAVDGKYHFQFETETQLTHFDWAPGLDGKVWNRGTAPMMVSLPDGWIEIEIDEDGTKRFQLLEDTFQVDVDEKVFLLAPPREGTVNLTVDGTTYELDPLTVNDYAKSTRQIVSGEKVIDLMKFQEANFPNRMPGEQTYADAIEYFANYFDELGYETEVDPFGFVGTGTCVQTPLGPICPESLSNVVAYKRGTTNPDKIIFVAGGHFDVVPGTTHGAFDNTGGTMATMELARALADYEFEHTIAFGLWGGEENGILGSQFWVQSNPTARLDVLSYVNLDVVGMSWPAPIVKPDPVMVAAGIDIPDVTALDGSTLDPLSQEMLDWMQTLQQDYFGFPDEFFLYEGVLSGQVAGYAGVNAQSDHTPFLAAGIPSYFIFNADALAGDNPVNIHSERDTLRNMTKYALFNNEFDLDVPEFASAEEQARAEAILAQSFETTMYFPLYHAILVDKGVHTPPGIQSSVPSLPL